MLKWIFDSIYLEDKCLLFIVCVVIIVVIIIMTSVFVIKELRGEKC